MIQSTRRQAVLSQRKNVVLSITSSSLLLMCLFLFLNIISITVVVAADRRNVKVDMAIIDPKTGAVDVKNEVNANPEIIKQFQKVLNDEIRAQGVHHNPKKDLTVEQLESIGSILQRAQDDSEVSLLLMQLMEQEGKEYFNKVKGTKTPGQIVQELGNIMTDMEDIEALFRVAGKEKMAEFKKEIYKQVSKERKEYYEKNPKVFEEDTRRKLYYSFVTMAAAGGYLSP